MANMKNNADNEIHRANGGDVATDNGMTETTLETVQSQQKSAKEIVSTEEDRGELTDSEDEGHANMERLGNDVEKQNRIVNVTQSKNNNTNAETESTNFVADAASCNKNTMADYNENDTANGFSSRTIKALDIPATVQYCLSSGILFEDPFFPANDTSLYKEGSLPAYMYAGVGVTSWRRPEQVSRSAVMFNQSKPPSNVRMGDLPDSQFIGALAVLSAYPRLMANLIAHGQHWRECGLLSCRIYKEGGWHEVVIDTRLPYCETPDVRRLSYSHCERKEEVWVALIEKAYAKLCGSYEAICGRNIGDVLVDLTGGSAQVMRLHTSLADKWQESQELWATLQSYLEMRIPCVLEDETESSNENGILFNRAFGILEVVETLSLRLIRIRNPWGGIEWRGAFSEHDQMWSKYPELKDILNYNFTSDGTWWMSFEDWCLNYNLLYVTRVFNNSNAKSNVNNAYNTIISVRDIWHDCTANGPPRYLPEEQEDENPLNEETREDQMVDNNSRDSYTGR